MSVVRTRKIRSLLTLTLSALLSVRVCKGYSQTETNGYSQKPEFITTEDGRVRGIRRALNETDFHIGGLVGIHLSAHGGRRCDLEYLEGGTEYVEAILFSIDAINRDSSILPDVTLGFDIRDSCISQTIAIDETLDWIQCSRVSIISVPYSDGGGSVLAGVVGPEPSYVSIPIASFFRIFQIPQVSYISTSPLLSNSVLYPYFLRTVPPDTTQAEVMIDILKTFGWTFTSVVYSSDAYGEQGSSAFLNLARTNGICIDMLEGIDDNYKEKDYSEIAEELFFDSTAEIIVAFAGPSTMIALLQQIQLTNSSRHFTWIASDAWARFHSVLDVFQDTLVGTFGVHPASMYYEDFNRYFSLLTPSNNARNPWFRGYCNQVTNNNCSNNASILDSTTCYSQNLATPFVVDAVYSIAHGLDSYLKDNCEQPVKWDRSTQSCKGQKTELTGAILLEYIKEVAFMSPTGANVVFNEFGDGNAAYEVFNLHKHKSDFHNELIGNWTPADGLTLSLPQAELQFGISEDGYVLKERKSDCISCTEGPAQSLPIPCCIYCSHEPPRLSPSNSIPNP